MVVKPDSRVLRPLCKVGSASAPPSSSATCRLIYEHKHFIAVNKPANTICQDEHTSASIKHIMRCTLPHLFVAKGEGFHEPKHVHRLDGAVTGALLFGTSKYGTKTLSTAFRKHSVTKGYLALLRQPCTSSHSSFLSPSSSSATAASHSSTPEGGKAESSIPEAGEAEFGKPCQGPLTRHQECSPLDTADSGHIHYDGVETTWHVLARLRPGPAHHVTTKSDVQGPERLLIKGNKGIMSEVGDHDDRTTYVCWLIPKQGKKHHLRIHCSRVLRAPILYESNADVLSSLPESWDAGRAREKVRGEGIALHCAKLEFKVGLTKHTVVSEVPDFGVWQKVKDEYGLDWKEIGLAGHQWRL